jgi:hypothetical protein
MQERENPQARLAVVPAGILHDQGRIPFQFGRQFKGKPSLRNVPLVLEGSKVMRMIYRYSNNATLSRIIAVAFIRLPSPKDMGSPARWAERRMSFPLISLSSDARYFVTVFGSSRVSLSA